MAGAQYGYPVGLWVYLDECDILGVVYAGSGWACTCISAIEREDVLICGRDLRGYTIASRSDCGCTRLWIMWMASRREGQEHRAD
jgi:hypothetical protein